MTRSEKVSEQFTMALNYLDLAESTLHKIREIELAEHDSLNAKFVELTDYVEDLQYQICAPMQMEEEESEKRAEIARLKARIAQLENELCY